MSNTAPDAPLENTDPTEGNEIPEGEGAHLGVMTDPTPNRNYTLAGVSEGAPTPETDPDAFDAAHAALNKGSRGDAMRQSTAPGDAEQAPYPPATDGA